MAKVSKDAVLRELADVLVEPNWEINEWCERFGGAESHTVRLVINDKPPFVITRGQNIHTARRRMISFARNFVGRR